MTEISNVTISINGQPIYFSAIDCDELSAAMPKPVSDTYYGDIDFGKAAIELTGFIMGGDSARRALFKMLRPFSICKTKSKQSRLIAVHPAK